MFGKKQRSLLAREHEQQMCKRRPVPLSSQDRSKGESSIKHLDSKNLKNIEICTNVKQEFPKLIKVKGEICKI